MARTNQFEALLDELHAASVDRGYSAQKPLVKSQTIREVMAKAGLDADKAKPFTGKPATIREGGVKVGDHVMVKGKTATTDKPSAEPREHTALRVARAIGEMKAYAQGKDLNCPVTEQQLQACHALARAGEMSKEEVADVEKAFNDKRALPTYILRKLSNA